MSKILFTNITIADPGGPHHGKSTNILFEGNTLVSIGGAAADADSVIDANGYHISGGWLDVLAFCGEPGEEWKEDIASLASAAQAGGFTTVNAYCGSHPVPDHAAAITSVVERAKNLPSKIQPLGAFTLGAEGKEMTEIFDMQRAGASAFFDGDHALNHNGLKARMLEYAANTGANILLYPFERNLAIGGSMHEGVESTKLGLKGMPSISEINALRGDIELAKWLKTPLKTVRISCAESVALVREAKAAGVKIHAAVPVMNLLFTDAALQSFDENYKVLPPLRTETDRRALINGLIDGTIDAVCSNHVPQDTENKDVEFDYAAYGAGCIQTTFSMLLGALGSNSNAGRIATFLHKGPAQMMGIKPTSVTEGISGNFTIFSTELEYTFSAPMNRSKSRNNPMIGEKLKGQVMGTLLDGKWLPNPALNSKASA